MDDDKQVFTVVEVPAPTMPKKRFPSSSGLRSSCR